MRSLQTILAISIGFLVSLPACGEAEIAEMAIGEDASSESTDAASITGDAGPEETEDAGLDAGLAIGDAGSGFEDAGAEEDAGTHQAIDAGAVDAGLPPPEPCVTRITYGSAWMHSGSQGSHFDDVAGEVTWDGVCHDDGANSYAVLSNGWRPYFAGLGACIIALDSRGDCGSPPPACSTRITYGSSWLHGPDHPAQFDDANGVVTWEGTCRNSGGNSFARLSNGWEPYFSGSNACSVSLRHRQCGGLFANPVIARDCPDPGVARAGNQYVLSCTGGWNGGTYPLFTSTDLVNWSERGFIFPAGSLPSWADSHFWAPEPHEVAPGRWVAYFSARNRSDGKLSVGAATATDALGPYTDLGHPLVHDSGIGLIDAHYFRASDGRRFLLWKVDGNAVGQATPIKIQELAADGVTLRGSATTILTNTLSWEGSLIEGPWMVERGGYFYLFYSANGYASASYAVGVARATSPLGPFTKASAPILVSNGAWGGPGHGSIIEGPRGETVHVYHAWLRDHIGEAPGRQVLVDRVTWSGGWPQMLGAPSARSQPLP